MPTTNAPTAVGSWYVINQTKGTDNAEILIYDEIGGFGVSAKQFVTDLRKIDAKNITVRLNSPGGSVIEGTAIYNALRGHGANIDVRIEGMALSAGSFIAMAGDEIQMANNAYMMIHNALGGIMGDAEEVRSYATFLEKVNDNIAGMYESRTGKDRQHWRGLMDAETWFTAEEAKAEGLVDTVYEAGTDVTNSWGDSKCFTEYSKVPQSLRKATPTNQQVNAPVDSTTSVEPTPAPTNQEVSAMPDATVQQSAPAQNPAPAENGSQQGVPTTPAEQLAQLRVKADESHYQRGLREGREEGKNAAHNSLKAIVAACPNKPQMAINAFLNHQSSDAVKIAYDAVVEGEVALEKQKELMQMEIERLKALNEIGGNSGVGMTVAGDDEYSTYADPQAQAEMEWDQKPAVHKGFSSKASYVAFRKNELEGKMHFAK